MWSPSRWSPWGHQIIYGLDVGKGEMRFCGFLGLDAFHTEIVWCEVPLQIIGLLRVLQKKVTQKKQRSKESCIPTHHTTPHYTRPPPKWKCKALATFEFASWISWALFQLVDLKWEEEEQNSFLLTASKPLFSLSQILPTLVYYEWMVSVQPNIYSQTGSSNC